MLIGIEQFSLALDLDFHGDYLFFKNAALDRRQGAVIAFQGELILLFARDAEFYGDIFRGHAHVVVIKNFPEPVVDHAVDHLGVEHPGSPPHLGDIVGDGAHVLDTPRHDDLGVAGLDRLRGQCYRLHTGGADLVHREGVDLLGHAGIDGGLAGGVLSLPGLEDVPHDDLVDHDFLQRAIPLGVFLLQVDQPLAFKRLRGEACISLRL